MAGAKNNLDKIKKSIAILFTIVLILNMALFVMHKISLLTFWVIIIIGAVVAFKGMKYIN